MIFEYAIDPEVLTTKEGCRSLIQDFKPEYGRVIADTPKRWVQEAYQAINSIPHEQCQPVMKKSIKNGLAKLLKQSLCGNRIPKDWDRNSETWLDHVASHSQDHPFSAVITQHHQAEPISTYALDELFINAPDCWNHDVQISIPRHASDIVDAMMPLFAISKQIILIDMHIYPNERKYNNVLLEIIARSGQYCFGRGINKLVIHTSDHRLDIESSIQRNLLPSLPGGFEVICHQWPRELEHDRFVVTDVAGLAFGHGLDEGRYNSDEEVLVSLINDATRRRLLSRFSGQPSSSCSVSK